MEGTNKNNYFLDGSHSQNILVNTIFEDALQKYIKPPQQDFFLFYKIYLPEDISEKYSHLFEMEDS